MWLKCLSGENHMQVGVVNPTYEAENLNNETRYPHLNSRARPAPLPLPMTTKGVESGCDRRTSGCYDELDEDRYTTLKSIGNQQSFDEGACRESEDGMTTLYFCHKPKKILIPEKIAVIILKFVKYVFYHRSLHPKDAYGMANSEDPDQTAPSFWSSLIIQERSDLGLQCL